MAWAEAQVQAEGLRPPYAKSRRDTLVAWAEAQAWSEGRSWLAQGPPPATDWAVDEEAVHWSPFALDTVYMQPARPQRN